MSDQQPDLKLVFDKLQIHLAKLTLDYSLQSKQKFEALINGFPDSQVSKLLNVFPRYLAMFKHPEDGMFFVAVLPELKEIQVFCDTANHSKIPHDFIVVTFRKTETKFNLVGSWVDKFQIKPLTELLGERFDYVAPKNSAKTIAEEYKVAI